jgi:hypothetical protein
MNGKFLFFGRDETENSLMHFVDRKISEQRRNERRLAEQRTTKYRFHARKSCVADARSYRVARRFPLLAIAQFDWKALIPTRRTYLFGIDCLKKLRNDQLKHWRPASDLS